MADVIHQTAQGPIRAWTSDLCAYIVASYLNREHAEDYIGAQLRTEGGDWQVWAVIDRTLFLSPGTPDYDLAESLALDLELLASFTGMFWGDAKAERKAKAYYLKVVKFLGGQFGPQGEPVGAGHWLAEGEQLQG